MATVQVCQTGIVAKTNIFLLIVVAVSVCLSKNDSVNAKKIPGTESTPNILDIIKGEVNQITGGVSTYEKILSEAAFRNRQKWESARVARATRDALTQLPVSKAEEGAEAQEHSGATDKTTPAMDAAKATDGNITDKTVCNGSDVLILLNGSDLEGRLEWEGHNRSVKCTWVIDFDREDSVPVGVALKLHEVRLAWGLSPDNDDTLSVHSSSDEIPVRELRQAGGRLPVAPILVHYHRVVVRLITHARSRDESSPGDPMEGSKFRLTYTAHPLETLPPEVGVGLYNCSPPYVAPRVLHCDMASQCVLGEDEMGCSYNLNSDCEGGVLFGNDCFRFARKTEPLPPDRMNCFLFGIDYNIASIVDDSVKNFLANITALYLHEEIFVRVRRDNGYIDYGSLYRFIWNSDDHMLYDDSDSRQMYPAAHCAVLCIHPKIHVKPMSCWRPTQALFACVRERKKQNIVKTGTPSLPDIDPDAITNKRGVNLKKCPDGSYVHLFYSCTEMSLSSEDFSPNNISLLRCENDNYVHYALVCDGSDDCYDGTDEKDCYNLWFDEYFMCTKESEKILKSLSCNGLYDCSDGSDERDCGTCTASTVECVDWGCVPQSYIAHGRINCNSVFSTFSSYRSNRTLFFNDKMNTSGVRRLDLDGYGMASLTQIKGTEEGCPNTHFQCKGHLCIPSYLVNNGRFDCPYPYEDEYETSSRSSSCTGYYRCYRSSVCLHPVYLCDGVPHCPQKDDERYCNMTCPQNCTCEGAAFKCTQLPDSWELRLARYVDLGGALQITRESLGFTLNAVFFNMSFCGLRGPVDMWFGKLNVLDLSYNQLESLDSLKIGFSSEIDNLNLSGNPIFKHFDANFSQHLSFSVRKISFSLRNTGIKHISANVFEMFTSLKRLDIRDNWFTFQKDSFLGLSGLQELHTDDPTVCCTFFNLYPKAKTDCVAPRQELSSCSDLLRTDFFRAVLWVLSLLALLGNVFVFVYRVFFESERTAAGYRVVVSNLCISDFLMGVYLLVIGSADARYKGEYLWKRWEWTQSTTCRAAGFLSIVSNEVSAFLVCLITVDRLLVLRLPLQRHLHLTARSAMMTCGAAWLVGVVLATVPLLPANESWQFYSQNGICLPLPITQHSFPGQRYAFAVFIVLNFLLFLLVGTGQLWIYQTIRSVRLAASTKRRQQDTVIARRLFLIVFSDFCCWFPVGVMGLLAVSGTPIPSVVNEWCAILVMPLNSALNPFLYTLNTLLERRGRRREQKRIKKILGSLRADIVTWPTGGLQELLSDVQGVLNRKEIKRKQDEEQATFRGLEMLCMGGMSGCATETETVITNVLFPLELACPRRAVAQQDGQRTDDGSGQ